MTMEKPKWGTCEDCRWSYDVDDGYLNLVCRRYPPPDNQGDYTQYPRMDSGETCGEWEPPEGKVCGCCWQYTGDVDEDDLIGGCWLAEVRTRDRESNRASTDTCQAWRWNGGE